MEAAAAPEVFPEWRPELALRWGIEDAVAKVVGDAGPDEVAAVLLDLAAACRVFLTAGLVGRRVADEVMGEAHDAVVLRGHPAPLRLPPLPDVGDLVVAAAGGSVPAAEPPELVAVVPVGRTVTLRSGEEAVITSVELWSDHTIVRVVRTRAGAAAAVAAEASREPKPGGGPHRAAAEEWVLGRVDVSAAQLVVAPGSVVASDAWAPAGEIVVELAGATECRDAGSLGDKAAASSAAGALPRASRAAAAALAALAEDHLARIRCLGHGDPVAAARRGVRAAAAALARAGVPVDDVAGDLDGVLAAAGYLAPHVAPARAPRPEWSTLLGAPRAAAGFRRAVPVARRVRVGGEPADLLVTSVEDWGDEWRLRANVVGKRGWAGSLPWRAWDDSGGLHVGQWLTHQRTQHGEEGEVVFVPGLGADCHSVVLSVGTVATVPITIVPVAG